MDKLAKRNLTKRTVDAAKATTKDYVLWDEALTGFGLRVRPTGQKSFVAVYRVGRGRGGTLRKLTIGKYGEKLTADQARAKAHKFLLDAGAGGDPALKLRHERTESTVSELCDLYLREGCKDKKASTLATDQGRIERHIKPLLGRKRISLVSQDDVERFLIDVSAGKTKVVIKTKKRERELVKGGKGTAARTVGLLGGIFSFAVRQKLRPDNPVRGVKRSADKKSARFLSPKELADLGQALRTLEDQGHNRNAIAILRLLTFTGARKTEIASLKWREVDIDHSCLRLEDSKTGAKIILLGPPALTILSDLSRGRAQLQLDLGTPSPFVFPPLTGESHFQGTEKVWRKARKLAGLPGVRIHDLRHSFASMGLASGAALPVIGALLGHADVKTTARYAHLADDPVRQAADSISNELAAAMSGAPKAKVVQFPKAKAVRGQ